jgi:ATP-dependent Lon protease
VNFKINDKVLEKIIEHYTRESGVRELDRQLASIMRFEAKELAMKNKIKSTLSIQDVEKILGQHVTATRSIKPQICPALQWDLHGPMLVVIFFY